MTITTPRWTREVEFRSWDDREEDRSFIRILAPSSLEVTLGAQLFLGTERTQYGDTPNFVFLQMDYYFYEPATRLRRGTSLAGSQGARPFHRSSFAMHVERIGDGGAFRLGFADAGEFVDVYGRQILARKIFLPHEKIEDLAPGEGCLVEVPLPVGADVFWLECRIATLEPRPPRGIALELAELSAELRGAIEAYITELLRGETPTTRLPAGIARPDEPSRDGGRPGVDRAGDEALALQEEATGRAQDGRSIQAQLREMSHAERIRLALTGGKAARAALIRNPQPVYHPYVVQNPRITRAELAAMAKNPNIAPEALRQIAANPQHISDPQVRLAVVKNPKTDGQIAQKLLVRLPHAQLRQIARSDDVRPNVKAAAMRLLSRSG